MNHWREWKPVDQVDVQLTLQFKFTWGHATENESTDDMGKTALVPPKAEKGELSMGLMVTSVDGSRRITWPLLKNPYRWWGNLWECRRPPQGVLHPKLLGLVR